MIKLNLAGHIVGMTRFFNAADKSAALEFVAASTATTVVCLDTPATPTFVEFVRELCAMGRQVVIRDHHDVAGEPSSPRDKEIRASADTLRSLLGDEAVISNRDANPACSSLVKTGEFTDEDYVLILDADPDGLTAGMKALGITYPELDADAALLDGPPTRRQSLSEVGELLNKAGATLPPFKDKSYEGACTSLYENWVKATQGDKIALVELSTKVEKLFEDMVVKAKAIATTATEVATGVWLVDVAGIHNYHMATLAADMEARPGCRVTVIRKDDGPIAQIGGVQYSLARHTSDEDLDMKNLFPKGFNSSAQTGMIGNVPFLIHASQKVWEEILLPTLKERFEAVTE